MDWQVVLIEPTKSLLVQIGNFVGRLIFILIILVIGWLIAKAIKSVVARFLQIVKLDDIAEEIKANEVLKKGGISYSVSELIGVVCYWLVLLITFVIAANALGLTTAAGLLNQIILYIPNIIAAIFIIIVGLFAATLLSNLVQTIVANAGIAQSKMLGKTVEIITIIFAVIIALEQLQITGILMIERIILIILTSLGLGLALAFGLGCKDIAGKVVADLLEKIKTKK